MNSKSPASLINISAFEDLIWRKFHTQHEQSETVSRSG